MANIETIRHSLSHIMAAAVQELYPETLFGIGPAIENGFYYDFDLSTAAPSEGGSTSLSPEDLPKIEKKMKDLLRKNIEFKKKELSKKEAKELFKKQPYKLELIEELEGKITVYESSNFVDLCKGPHVKSTKEIPADAFKLTNLAGAYWRGDEKNKMLTRIYGVAFENKEELEKYLKQREEAEKRDHRILGQKLELFMFDEEVGQGLPLWMPKGAILQKEVMNFALETYLDNGYQLVSTPHIASNELWKHSGHVEFYKEGLYGEFEVEKESYRLKPMNCPFHIAIYKNKPRSYRDLPVRYTEMGTVYRYERSGVLHGLSRVRGFTQDDAHIICAPEQLREEIKNSFNLTLEIFRAFGFKDFEVNLSVRDPQNKDKFIGSDEQWEKAEDTLRKVIEEVGFGKNYVEDVGGAVFYGPKIDIKVEDAIGRKWQLSTIQFDFNLPSRFEMTYTGQDGEKHIPYMVHRAILGSVERFIGVLIEHYGGAFPLWLSPVQIQVIPVGSRHSKYANEVGEILREKDFRTEIKDEAETVSKKIRQGEIEKIPYMLVIGDEEEKSNSVRIRQRGRGDVGVEKLEKFLKKVEQEKKERQIF